MASVSFEGTLISDNPSNPEYGEYKVIEGSVNSEIYTRDFPPSDGVMEVSAGDRDKIITISVVYMTTNPASVNSMLDDLLREKRYHTLTYPDGVGGTTSQTYCRLSRVIPGGVSISGRRDGNAVFCMKKELVFRKVRLD